MKPAPEKRLVLGILAGISTGVFWGLPFLVPQVLPHHSALEIAFGRFFFFGMISLLFIKKVIQIVKALSRQDRWMLLFLSASGFWLYSTLLFWGVHETDGVISSLVISLLPVVIPLFTPDRKSGGMKFYFGLLLLGVGLFCLFFGMRSEMQAIKPTSWIGLGALGCCLGLWSSFAILNSRFLKRNAHIGRKDFASVMGVISLLCLLPIFLVEVNPLELVQRDGFQTYLWSSMALGFGSSWLANWLWNICSFHCPSEISGALIVSETIFGLTYSFIYELRLPQGYELVSISLFMLGVYFAVSAQIQEHRKTRSV